MIVSDPAVLVDLLVRVEAASGADRELDGDLWWVLDHASAQHYFNTGALGLPREYPATLPIPAGLGRAGVQAMAPKFTVSLDAALALVERVLPSAHVSLYSIGAPWSRWQARVVTEHDGDELVTWFDAVAATPARALLVAMLNALLSKAPGAGQ